MNDEDAFLDALAADPQDEHTRRAYADWLDERGEPARAEFLRLDSARHDEKTTERKRDAVRKRLAKLRDALPADWLLLVDRAAIEGCFHSSLSFRYECPKRWETLQPTGEASVRFCDECRKKVFYCTTVAHAQRHALRGHCVAVASPAPRKQGDLKTDPTRDPHAAVAVLGMPAPPAPRYAPGQSVTVMRGRFRGAAGTVEQVHLSALRATVRLQTSAGEQVAQIDFEDLDGGRPLRLGNVRV